MKDNKFVLKDNIDVVYEKIITKFGSGAKMGSSQN